MPELKHNFTKGKMNKDRDERLIPNGEYKDAMNIQVSTSEGSDVGAAQNILGNSIVPGQEFIGDNSVCVGSIADEKNDKLYYFVIDYDEVQLITNGSFDNNADGWSRGANPLPSGGWDYNPGNKNITATNVAKFVSFNQYDVRFNHNWTYIVSCDISNFTGTGDLSPVIVDNNGFWTRPGNNGTDYIDYVANSNNSGTAVSTKTWTLIAGQNNVEGQQSTFAGGYTRNQIYFQNRAVGSGDELTCDIDNISVIKIGGSYITQYDTKTNKITPVFVDVGNNVLKFDSNNLITGINIIDDLLFWTDNNSEPKKINIQRCIQGTSEYGNSPTFLINPKQGIDISNKVPLEEQHITVAKKPPKSPPHIESHGFRNSNLDYTGIITISDSLSNRNSFKESSIGKIHDFSFLEVGDTFSTIIETDINNSNEFSLEWKPWAPVVLKEFSYNGDAPAIPIIDYRIKGKITDWQLNSFSNTNFLLTENGEMGGTGYQSTTWQQGLVPISWDGHSAWTWDPSSKKFTCDGSFNSHNSWTQIWNNNTLRDIEHGKFYVVKYTVGEPDNKSMTGEVLVRLHDSDSVAGPSGNYMNLDQHDTPGEYEHEFMFDNTAQGPSPSSAKVLNAIRFTSRPGATGVGHELVDFHQYNWVTPGTFAGTGVVNFALSVGQPPPQWVWNTWLIHRTNRIEFSRVYIDDVALVNYSSTHESVFISNVMTESLEDGEEYEITLTVSNMQFSGGNSQRIGLPNWYGVGQTMRITNYPTSNGVMWTQATANDPWTGKGGSITHTFTAAVASGSTEKLDINVWRSGGISSTEGPSGIIDFSVRKKIIPGFNGSISNVSVKELDETVARVEVRIEAIDGTPPKVQEGETSLNYAIDLYQQEEDRLFEHKFPRFAYRYKYLDGECSAISPFSDIVFSAGAFDYHPKKGYNLGMINNLKYIEVKDYNLSLPGDVAGIDLLYKEENSPNIYIIDSIKDFSSSVSSYEIKGEAIRGGVLPSNQLVRPWDNVPRKALAQEVVGNRVVYGNYVQNYNLKNSLGLDWDADIEVTNAGGKNSSQTGKKSVKSLRDYQVGIVFGDEYGRETPILTNTKAITKITKANSSTSNQLTVNILNQEHPVNMKYFKFFVKDTAGEYYNLAMDRYYDAEDDNIWLAFPSTDRNKIDIDDYLILKKGAGNAARDPKTKELESIIREKAQYKVLDIKNEAPDFIKRKETLIASVRHDPVNDPFFKSTDLPSHNDINFQVEHNRIKTASYATLHENFGANPDVEYHITLSNTDINRVSDRYKVIELHGDFDVAPIWYITLERPFSSEVNDFTNDETGTNSTKILNNTYLNIYRTAPDNSASHKFDGRFFVKIFNDDIFAKALKENIDDIKKEYKSTGIQRKIYSLKTIGDTNRIEKIAADFGTASITSDASNAFYRTKYDFDHGLAKGLNPKVASNTVKSKGGFPLFSWQRYIKATTEFNRECGTLNGKKRIDPSIYPDMNREVSNLRHEAVWHDYDAYFRGINVYLGNGALSERTSTLDVHNDDSNYDQVFQDVWFIDAGTDSGYFHYSKIANPDESDFSAAVGWKSWPESWSRKGRGIQSFSSGFEGNSEIELGFGGVQPIEWTKGDYVYDPSFFDLDGANTNYSEEEGDFIKKIAIGSQFKFKEDPDNTVYTITGVDNIYKVRYENLRFYAGHGVANFMGDDLAYYRANWPYGWLESPHLSSLQSKAVYGEKATGMYIPGGSHGVAQAFDNVSGNYSRSGLHYETKIAAEDPSIKWGTCSFMRPSNYTRNWRIKVDKAFNDYWNPVEDTGGEISSSVPVALSSSGVGSSNSVSTTGTTSISAGDTRKVAVGMVLSKYYDDSGGSLVDMNPPAIVSKIDISSNTIYLKTYDGSDGWAAAGTGRPAETTSPDILYFYQYPMNGLSPNAAKNLNYFREGHGFNANKAGTDAVGYTWEWVEEKSSRSEEEILPTNPAVWETKVKDTDTKDLNIYHEATGCIPIYAELTKENIFDLIPIGSKVEHEGSNAIPFGTVIHDIDPDAEQIILSNNVLIDPTLDPGDIYLAWLQSFGWTPGTVPVNYGGNQKIICTELCEQGFIPKEVLDLDYQHSDNNMDMETKIGYWKWATPIVNRMRESKLFTQIIKPFGVAWAYEMAHREEPTKYNGNILGKFLMLVGVPLCRYIGNKEINKNSIQI